MGHPAKITKSSAKSLLSLLMGESKWDEAYFPCFHLIPSVFIEFYKKKCDLRQNRHLHTILYKSRQFLLFDSLSKLNYHVELFFFHLYMRIYHLRGNNCRYCQKKGRWLMLPHLGGVKWVPYPVWKLGGCPQRRLILRRFSFWSRRGNSHCPWPSIKFFILSKN